MKEVDDSLMKSGDSLFPGRQGKFLKVGHAGTGPSGTADELYTAAAMISLLSLLLLLVLVLMFVNRRCAAYTLHE